MHKNFILDTNVLLHDPDALFKFDDNCVLVPIEVIEEIDSFKRYMDELGRNSRLVAHSLDKLRKCGKLGAGVLLPSGGTVRVVYDQVRDDAELDGLHLSRTTDSRMLALALRLRKTHPEQQTSIVTKNVNLRLKADAVGIDAADYEMFHFPEGQQYQGWRSLQVDAAVVDALRDGQAIVLQNFSSAPNEYLCLSSRSDPQHSVLARLDSSNRQIKALALNRLERGVVNITALNLEQTFALDALLDDRLPLVTLTGRAGTGKTLLAMAAGLHKVFVEDAFNRVLVFRPTMPVGKDLGFLPGDVAEKMRPWMQPVYDALELIREQDKRSRTPTLPPDLLDCDEISIEPLTYIRGRSIPRQYIIIDEAQNLTPLEVKTVITRVGRDTKVILTGDPDQIDNPYVDHDSNGLTYLVQRFRTSGLAAHIDLIKGERSILAENAANLL